MKKSTTITLSLTAISLTVMTAFTTAAEAVPAKDKSYAVLGQGSGKDEYSADLACDQDLENEIEGGNFPCPVGTGLIWDTPDYGFPEGDSPNVTVMCTVIGTCEPYY